MATNWTDTYPTAAFPAADEAVKLAHKAYREHVLHGVSQPDLVLIHEQTRHEQLSEAKEPASELVLEDRAPEARAARDLVRQAREGAKRQRFNLNAMILAAAAWLSSGLAGLCGPWIEARMQLPIAPWLYVVGVAIAISLFVLWILAGTAKNYQIVSEAQVKPEEIPHLAQIGNVIRKEEFEAEELTEAQQRILDRKLGDYLVLRRANKRVEVARLELKPMAAVSVTFGLLLMAAGMLHFGYASPKDAMISFIAAVLPTLALGVFTLRLAEVSLDVPEMPSYENISAAEAARQAATEKRSAAAREGHRNASERAIRAAEAKGTFEQAQRGHRATAESLLSDLRSAANTWEKERGFTHEERAYMEAERQHRAALSKGVWALSVACAFLATYPASIALADRFGMSFTYFPFTGLTRFSFMTWGFWIFVVIVAELALVLNLATLKRLRYGLDVLQNGYDELARREGKRYAIKSEPQVREESRAPRRWLGLAIFLLSLEFAANISYMIYNSDAGVVSGFFFAIVPFIFMLVWVSPLHDWHYALAGLNEALGRDGWQQRIRRGGPGGNNQEKRESARDEREKMIEEGYRSINDRRKMG